MAIWTSRYSNKELVENKDKYYCVGISLGTPKFPLGYTVEQQCYSLAPKGYGFKDKLIRWNSDKLIGMESISKEEIDLRKVVKRMRGARPWHPLLQALRKELEG